ncbi:Putative glycosyl hydrolase family 53, glycoside hydrolase superfamily [Septoria linicola]|uniref:Arabinogalactan endo-beta-1,4-galactanase n=1 Tax=Septoria linicola TaxID=215465 RepID=A0A9Q9AN45_9PEZI|nr:putative glycosyl hydrolase family 53, glycoside hydrolase superfamily [Septoria linicola]USW52354.1 Putative glycosyl hydrolase family 53, glycoside hydrolase superfamily [Septoria linicola]
MFDRPALRVIKIFLDTVSADHPCERAGNIRCLTYKGIGWSSLLLDEGAAVSYSNADGTPQALETILKDSGVNTVRQRIWNDPSDGNYDLDYNLKLAQRAEKAGLEVYLDFHLSDTWADPSHQTTPSAWADYSIDDLSWAGYNYTLATMNAFEDAGIPLSLVSMGNEIRAGMLWPLGSTDSPVNLARLLHSASAGIKDSNIAQPKIMIHLDNGWDQDTQEWRYDLVLSQGTLTLDDFDVQGVSFYPFSNQAATVASLQSSLAHLKGKYGREVMVVETNWPQRCSSPAYEFPSDVDDVPFSAAGQTTWLKDVAGAVEAAGGNDLFYWEPAWLDNAGSGSSCENNLLFDATGKALSSLAVFQDL